MKFYGRTELIALIVALALIAAGIGSALLFPEQAINESIVGETNDTK